MKWYGIALREGGTLNKWEDLKIGTVLMCREAEAVVDPAVRLKGLQGGWRHSSKRIRHDKSLRCKQILTYKTPWWYAIPYILLIPGF